jgi:hypothetical protein
MLCLPYYACVFSSTKLVIRAEQVLPETEWGRGKGWGGGAQGGEMTQTMYAHVEKRGFSLKKKKDNLIQDPVGNEENGYPVSALDKTRIKCH